MKKKKKVKVLRHLNKPILALTLLFAIAGAFFILDASSISATQTYGKDSPYFFFGRQLLFIFGSFFLALGIIRIDTKRYEKLSLIFIVICLALTGYKVLSNQITGDISALSIDLKIMQIQPAEFLKVFVTLYIGNALGKSQALPYIISYLHIHASVLDKRGKRLIY